MHNLFLNVVRMKKGLKLIAGSNSGYPIQMRMTGSKAGIYCIVNLLMRMKMKSVLRDA